MAILDNQPQRPANSIDDIVDILSEGDDNKPIELEEPKKEEKEEKKEIELEEETEEEKEPTEDDLQLETPVPRKEILKAYPDIFKKFPYLEKAMYREQAYTEVFPTIDDAKEAADKVQTYEKFEESVLSGSIDAVLKSAAESDKDAFGKIVDNYLPALQKTDQNAYYHVLGTVINNTIRAMVQEGHNTENDQLKGAAQILNQFVFGTSNAVPPSLFGPAQTKNSEKEELEKERNSYLNERYETAKEDLSTRVENLIKGTISVNIDTKNVMTDYVKKTAIKDAMEITEQLLESDTRFRTLIDKLWEKAIESKFSKSSIDQIQKAYVSKAKTVLPSAIQKSRNAALKGLGKRVVDEVDDEPKRKPLPTGSPRNNNENKQNNGKGKSTLDFFMED